MQLYQQLQYRLYEKQGPSNYLQEICTADIKPQIS